MNMMKKILIITLSVNFLGFGLVSHALTNVPDDEVKIHLRIISLKSRTEAIEIIMRLEKGESFNYLAKEKSIHPSSKSGGDIGDVMFSDLREEFQIALKSVGEKKYTRIVEIGDDFFILYVEAINSAKETENKNIAKENKEKFEIKSIPINNVNFKSTIELRLLEYISEKNFWEVDSSESSVRGELISFWDDKTCRIKATSLSTHGGYLHILLTDGCLFVKITSDEAISEFSETKNFYESEIYSGYYKLEASSSKGQFIDVKTSLQTRTSTSTSGVIFAPLNKHKRAERMDMDYSLVKDESFKEILLYDLR